MTPTRYHTLQERDQDRRKWLIVTCLVMLAPWIIGGACWVVFR